MKHQTPTRTPFISHSLISSNSSTHHHKSTNFTFEKGPSMNFKLNANIRAHFINQELKFLHILQSHNLAMSTKSYTRLAILQGICEDEIYNRTHHPDSTIHIARKLVLDDIVQEHLQRLTSKLANSANIFHYGKTFKPFMP